MARGNDQFVAGKREGGERPCQWAKSTSCRNGIKSRPLCSHVAIAVQTHSLHRRPFTLRVPCVIFRSRMTNRIDCSARLLVGLIPSAAMNSKNPSPCLRNRFAHDLGGKAGDRTLLAIRFERRLIHFRGPHQTPALLLELDGAHLSTLLFLLQFSFFLWTELGLLLLFPFAFVFTSLVTHICLSMIENKCPSQLRQASLTFSALGPFGPRPSLNDTRCPSWSSS